MNTPKAIDRHLFLLVVLAGLILIYFLDTALNDIIRHAIITTIAVISVHLIDHWYLSKQTIINIKDAVSTETRIAMQDHTNSLRQALTSVGVMKDSGIVQIYLNREAAAEDIETNLKDERNTEIRIMGVSLNDFLRNDNPRDHLRQLWTELKNRIEKDIEFNNNNHKKVFIKMMLIDPRCFGALLRSKGEERSDPNATDHLEENVNDVIPHLANWEKISKNNKNVIFECRLYRTAPILFLCQTDFITYMQGYYMWSIRSRDRQIPVLKFQQDPARPDKGTPPLHEELEKHFDWIWEHDSISVCDFYEKHEYGLESGAGLCRLHGIHFENNDVIKRVEWLLINAKKRIWIQGISLHNFFKYLEWITALTQKIYSGIEVTMLLLDPECEQALYRSYRESPDYSKIAFNDFIKSGKNSQSKLSTDHQNTIDHAIRIIEYCKSNNCNCQSNFKLANYKSAPGCFMMIVDDEFALVEQYHYGKVQPPGVPQGIALGKDMPLLEFRNYPHKLYRDKAPNERSPFDLLKDHFEFALKQSNQIIPLKE
jgi:hypothetical protein